MLPAATAAGETQGRKDREGLRNHEGHKIPGAPRGHRGRRGPRLDSAVDQPPNTPPLLAHTLTRSGSGPLHPYALQIAGEADSRPARANSTPAPAALLLPGCQKRPGGSTQGAHRSALASSARRRNETDKRPRARQSLTL
ncbi:hypothetical protein NDU88_007572 [Pleurodeles waltl]|uniref:Uncharacterized protein n=1 Tax=Pleurodeles waltl TaxID=8319 RepID=A0AAV7NTZ7_PLEWA|nr:hypothetical protein NDU88_007572 [Pleurodeles waltl]